MIQVVDLTGWVLGLQIGVGSGNTTVGVAALASRGQYTHAYWYWIGLGALFGLAIIYNIGFTIALGYMPGKNQRMLFQKYRVGFPCGDLVARREASFASVD